MELSTIGFDISKLQDGFARGFWTPEDVVRELLGTVAVPAPGGTTRI